MSFRHQAMHRAVYFHGGEFDTFDYERVDNWEDLSPIEQCTAVLQAWNKYTWEKVGKYVPPAQEDEARALDDWNNDYTINEDDIVFIGDLTVFYSDPYRGIGVTICFDGGEI